MKVLLSFLLLSSLVACSGSKSTNEADQTEAGSEMAETDFSEDFSDDFGGEGDAFASEGGFEEPAAEGGFDEPAPVDEVAEITDQTMSAGDQNAEMGGMPEASAVSINGSMGTHTVAANETLMIIAFKLFGDYDRWRDLAQWNAGKLGPNHSISVGMTLDYEMPAQPFVWNPEGNPYLIKSGDTLGSISNDTYGTTSYWRNIFDNNRPLIKDPNRIFAGFTLYTPVIDGRGVANSGL